MYLSLARCAALLALVMSIGACLAEAQKSRSYTFVVGSGFLCDFSDTTCPVIAKATRGDSYEFSGAGGLDAQDKSIRAAGTFTHKASNGHVLETGVWIASDLVSFVSYGSAPSALLRETSAFGPIQFDPRHMKIRMLSEPMPTGGVAVFRVHLMPVSGMPRNAVLQVNCALGEVPSEHATEGIQLTIDGNGGEYSESVGGRVMFLAMPRAVSSPTKGPEREPASSGTEIRRN